MSAFVLVAALLTLLVLGAIFVPLLRRGATPAARGLAVATAVMFVAGGALLYPAWSTWEWDRPEPAADSPVAMVGKLARRLEKQPEDLPGWLMLGKSYAVLGQLYMEQGQEDHARSQYALSARAFQRADTLAKGKSRDALIGLGEVLVELDSNALAGRAGQMFEKALALDPSYVKAILYGAFAAARRNDAQLARTRFNSLLASNPPDELRKIIEQQLQGLDAAATAVAVPVRVTISEAAAVKAKAGAPLFILARTPGQKGPPLAAKRLDANFPQEVDLLSTDAMVAGTGFAAGQELEIEARVANGGSAISASGDPFGTVRVKAGSNTRVAVEINQLKP